MTTGHDRLPARAASIVGLASDRLGTLDHGAGLGQAMGRDRLVDHRAGARPQLLGVAGHIDHRNRTQPREDGGHRLDAGAADDPVVGGDQIWRPPQGAIQRFLGAFSDVESLEPLLSEQSLDFHRDEDFILDNQSMSVGHVHCTPPLHKNVPAPSRSL